MLETPLRAEHENRGASLGTYFGCLLPERFSDFSKEYRWARDAVAVLDTNYFAAVSFTGPDRVRYLNALLTNNIQDLTHGHGCAALLLNPQGHILSELEVYAMPDQSFFTLSHALVRERTASTLDKYIIMDDVTMEDLTDHQGCIAVEGSHAADVVKNLCGIDLMAMSEFDVAETKIGASSCFLARRSHYGLPGARFLAARELIPTLWRVLLDAARPTGGGPVGYAALNALRIQAGIPWFSYDFDDTVIPHEAGLESTHISFSKGCYTGQEIVERVRSRGHVNRRLVGLRFTSRIPPERGAKLLAEGHDVGHVTSAAFSPALAGVIGMGYLRREHNSTGSSVECASGGTATVVELPFEAQQT
ncbi:MAG: glycine cleavage T C-terminal barrel domain-containing protein [Candidatus Acidiferrales bacterium]